MFVSNEPWPDPPKQISSKLSAGTSLFPVPIIRSPAHPPPAMHVMRLTSGRHKMQKQYLPQCLSAHVRSNRHGARRLPAIKQTKNKEYIHETQAQRTNKQVPHNGKSSRPNDQHQKVPSLMMTTQKSDAHSAQNIKHKQ